MNLRVEVDNFSVGEHAIGHFQAYTRLDLMKALLSRGAGVDEEHTSQLRHTFHAQDMTVTTNEHIRRIPAECRSDPRRPLPRPAADVRHPEPESLNLEVLVFRYPAADVLTVDVAPHRPNGGYGFEPVQYLRRAYVARVQNKIRVFEDVGEFGMKVAVRVREDTNAHYAVRELIFKGLATRNGASHTEQQRISPTYGTGYRNMKRKPKLRRAG